MFSSIPKIKLCMLIWFVCTIVILINITTVTAQDSNSPAPSGCVSCDDVLITCPPCPEGSKCSLTIRTCFECPKPKCSKPSPDNIVSENSNKVNNVLLPAVIGGVLGVGFLTAVGYGTYVWKRGARNEKGVKLDNNDEMTTISGENVIPIAYIPSTTPTSESSYQASNINIGTTPLASPLSRNPDDEQLIDVVDDDTATTILQATKSAPTATTATLLTATRAKPALVRLNTIKQTNKDIINSTNSINENNIPNSPDTFNTSNTFLNASTVPSSPTTSIRIGGDSDTEQMMPHQSSPQLQRESIMSSSSSNGRSTVFSDDGDGEITIFWGGNIPPLMGEESQTQIKKTENHVDSTDKDKNEEIKPKEST